MLVWFREARTWASRVKRERSGEGLAFDKLHDNGALFDAVDSRDVGVVERREDLRFAGEAGEAVGVGSESVGEDFDGDVAGKLGVGGSVDGPHSAFAYFGGDSVVGDGGLRGQWGIISRAGKDGLRFARLSQAGGPRYRRKRRSQTLDSPMLISLTFPAASRRKRTLPRPGALKPSL